VPVLLPVVVVQIPTKVPPIRQNLTIYVLVLEAVIVVVFATVVQAAVYVYVYVYFRAVVVTAAIDFAIDIPDVPTAADVAADGFGVAVVVVVLAVGAAADSVVGAVAVVDFETFGLVVGYCLLWYY
jgi:hypothetical protein